MQKINQRLWGTYELQFPVENKVSYLIGANGSGKMHVLHHLADYFKEKGESALFFKEERLFTHPPQYIYALLQHANESIQAFLTKYDIIIEELFLESEYGEPIHRGKIQLVHFLCSILLLKKESILIIDEPERNLQLTFLETLIEDLFQLPHVKQVITATHAPLIIRHHRDTCVDINECILK